MSLSIGTSEISTSAHRFGSSAHRFRMIFLMIVIVALSSCRTQQEFEKRKYTDGIYHDFELGKHKLDKTKVEAVNELPVKITERIADTPAVVWREEISSAEVFKNSAHRQQMEAAAPAVSPVANISTVKPVTQESIIAADTLRTLTGLVTGNISSAGINSRASSEVAGKSLLSNLNLIPIIVSPFLMVISMITGMLAVGRLKSGKKDRTFKRYMVIWTSCLLINLCIAVIILT